jgi:hypothetical protein
MRQVVFDDPGVTRLILDLTECSGFGPGHSIGVVDSSGDPIGGTFIESSNGANCWMHCAGLPGRMWITRRFLFEAFAYPFLQLGCTRATGWVEASNIAARRLDEHLGFEIDARLKGAARDGGDVFLYVMWRDKCRFLRKEYVANC